MNLDPYVILELPRGAPEAAVRQAFRKLALRYHPDRNPGDVEAEARFKLISAAYQRLKVAGFRAPEPATREPPPPGPSAPPPRWGYGSEGPSEEEEQWEPPPRPEFWPDGRRIHYPTQREIEELVRSLQRPTALSSFRVWGDWLVQSVGYVYVALMVSFVVAGLGLLGYVAVWGVRGWLGLN